MTKCIKFCFFKLKQHYKYTFKVLKSQNEAQTFCLFFRCKADLFLKQLHSCVCVIIASFTHLTNQPSHSSALLHKYSNNSSSVSLSFPTPVQVQVQGNNALVYRSESHRWKSELVFAANENKVGKNIALNACFAVFYLCPGQLFHSDLITRTEKSFKIIFQIKSMKWYLRNT